MKARILTTILVLSAMLIVPRIMRAHHNYAAVHDGAKGITLVGKVKEYKYQNPHIEIFIEVTEVTGADGKKSVVKNEV